MFVWNVTFDDSQYAYANIQIKRYTKKNTNEYLCTKTDILGDSNKWIGMIQCKNRILILNKYTRTPISDYTLFYFII